jgi:hypothetical protein
MEGVIPNQTGAKSRVADVIGRYPGVIPLVVAVILGLVVFPAIANGLKDHDVQINSRISLINLVWLGIAVVLSIVCLVARSSLRRELGEGLRKLIVGTQSTETPSRPGGSSTPDLPGLGVGIVRGLFDLLLLLIVQGIVRAPLVGVVDAYQPKAIVDGVFVALVVLISLIMLFGLYRKSCPLTEHLVAVGLDRVVPTAGFAAGNLPDTPAPRTITRTSVPSSASRASSESTVASGVRMPSSDAPTIAAAATIAAPAEATVVDPRSMVAASSEATIAAPLEAPPAPSSPVVEPAAGDDASPSGVDERTIVADKTLAGEATILSSSREDRAADEEPSQERGANERRGAVDGD